MPTLLMRLEAPMQSYGVFSRFSEKDTGKEPSKSAVLGLVCSAFGIERSEDISWLIDYKFGVRIDREGIVRNDYHIAGKEGYYRAAGNIEKKNAIPTNRHYLADASFLVGLETKDRVKLEQIQTALKNPKWQIFLGKKSFVPSLPIWIKDGIKETSLIDSLINHPLNSRYNDNKRNKDTKVKQLRFVVDNNSYIGDEAIMISKVMDVPTSFEHRFFGERETATLMINISMEGN